MAFFVVEELVAVERSYKCWGFTDSVRVNQGFVQELSVNSNGFYFLPSELFDRRHKGYRLQIQPYWMDFL